MKTSVLMALLAISCASVAALGGCSSGAGDSSTHPTSGGAEDSSAARTPSGLYLPTDGSAGKISFIDFEDAAHYQLAMADGIFEAGVYQIDGDMLTLSTDSGETRSVHFAPLNAPGSQPPSASTTRSIHPQDAKPGSGSTLLPGGPVELIPKLIRLIVDGASEDMQQVDSSQQAIDTMGGKIIKVPCTHTADGAPSPSGYCWKLVG